MVRRIGFIAFLILFTHVSFSQGIQDSTFQIQVVEISADRIFRKETAGMKETQVDTLVLLQKVNLSLSELLSENTPVFIKSHGRGALATASFRGTAASHTQVNWNGININSPMAGMVDFSLIPVYIIDEMNLKHGTASIADQSGGLGGS
ncbi:MAG TPA: TonB-dependent receptor, partial [Bacteroidales bacterium]|nr:TonB-dependent receptor [Bacteroidales bacterium]